jgi:hypothetical protein
MLGTPFTGVCRVYPDHCDPAPMRHRGQPGAELRGRDAGHGAAKPFPSLPPAHGVAARGAGVGEVEVLHHDSRTTLLRAQVEQGGDRRSDPPIPPG